MEVEIKISIDEVFLDEDPQTYITNKIGSSFEEIKQIDTYFQSPIKKFQQTDEALRIRQISNKGNSNIVEVTYKGPKIGNDMKIREELTLVIDNPHICLKMFERLGFTAVAEVKKKRVNWKKNSIILSLDDVFGLGTFLEAEMIVSEKSQEIHSSTEEILGFLKEIFPKWSGKEDRRSYLELLSGII